MGFPFLQSNTIKTLDETGAFYMCSAILKGKLIGSEGLNSYINVLRLSSTQHIWSYMRSLTAAVTVDGRHSSRALESASVSAELRGSNEVKSRTLYLPTVSVCCSHTLGPECIKKLLLNVILHVAAACLMLHHNAFTMLLLE